jgi:murein DD-endopeptidase MepM/ murein hydrolase activator NlpD
VSDVTQDFDAMNNALQRMDTLLKEITTSAQGLNLALGSISDRTGSRVTNTGVGQIGLGSSGGNIMSSSLANVPQILQSTNRLGVATGFAQGAVSMLTGAGAAFLGALPNVEATTARSAAAYQVGLTSGTDWQKVGKATFTNMKGGITEPGGDMITGSILSSFGIQAKLGASGQLVGGSQYQAITSSVANAAKYLNMPNADAAMALGSLTSGTTSSALMQNFGMFTTNPNTGERGTPAQIFSGLKNRMGLNNFTLDEINTGLQGGMLGATIESSGLDQGQQQLFKNYLQLSAQGVDMFSSDPAEIKKMENIVGYNPMQPSNDVNSAMTGTMQAASGAYVEGMQKAAVAVEAFEKVIQNFVSGPVGNALAQLNAGVSLAMKDPGVAGAAAGVGAVAKGGMDILGTAIDAATIRMLMKGKGGEGLGAGPKVNGKFDLGKSLKTGLGKGLKGGLIAAGASLVSGVAGDFISSGSEQGSFQSKAGGFVAGAGTGAGIGAMIGSIIPGLGTGIGAAIGGLIGGGIGAFSGGENSTVTGASVTNTGGKGFTLIHPVNGPITCKYGTKDELHPSGHYAVDYGVPTGTPVKAAASGTVVAVGSGSGARSYGNNIEISHADGFSTMYAHLNSSNVRIGQTVTQGEVVAQSGNTGFSSGPHLHFELRKNGAKIDPSPYLGAGVSSGGTINSSPKAASGSIESSAVSITGANSAGMSTGISNLGSIIPASYKGATAGRSGAGYSLANKNATNGRTATQNGAMGGISTGGVGGDGEGVSIGGNNVTINVSIKEASEAEARKFANMVKELMEEKTLNSSMGRM